MCQLRIFLQKPKAAFETSVPNVVFVSSVANPQQKQTSSVMKVKVRINVILSGLQWLILQLCPRLMTIYWHVYSQGGKDTHFCIHKALFKIHM